MEYISHAEIIEEDEIRLVSDGPCIEDARRSNYAVSLIEMLSSRGLDPNDPKNYIPAVTIANRSILAEIIINPKKVYGQVPTIISTVSNMIGHSNDLKPHTVRKPVLIDAIDFVNTHLETNFSSVRIYPEGYVYMERETQTHMRPYFSDYGPIENMEFFVNSLKDIIIRDRSLKSIRSSILLPSIGALCEVTITPKDFDRLQSLSERVSIYAIPSGYEGMNEEALMKIMAN